MEEPQQQPIKSMCTSNMALRAGATTLLNKSGLIGPSEKWRRFRHGRSARKSAPSAVAPVEILPSERTIGRYSAAGLISEHQSAVREHHSVSTRSGNSERSAARSEASAVSNDHSWMTCELITSVAPAWLRRSRDGSDPSLDRGGVASRST
jgi:hypothetical protein